MTLILRQNTIKSYIFKSVLRYSSSVPEIEHNETVLLEDTEESLALENEINKKRNISRLSPAHYNIIHGRKPYNEAISPAHFTVKYHRKLYGKYSTSSEVDPSICWPSQKDIEDSIEYESVAYPFTIQEMIASAAEKRKLEKEKIENREKEIAVKFAKIGIWKKELQDKLAKKELAATLAKEKKERLLEDIRRQFGFKLDPRDERFKEMLAKKEKEQKKIEKTAKKEAREKAMLANLQKQSSEVLLNEKE